jgi:peptide/nickel transport system permease protein
MSQQIRDTFRRITSLSYELKENPLFLISVSIILFLILSSVLVGTLALHDPTKINLEKQMNPPSWEHIFGTDFFGRDVLIRILFGLRIAFLVGFISVVISSTVGVFLGAISGYVGGKTDGAIMRIIDIVLSFPPIILAIAVASALGRNLSNAIIAISIVAIPGFARVTRGQVLSIKEDYYVEGARAIGENNLSIILRYILPNCLSPIVVQMTLQIGQSILLASGLGFLGLGAQPPTPDLGMDIATGTAFIREAPWISTFPGIAILLNVLGWNLLGDVLSDIIQSKR